MYAYLEVLSGGAWAAMIGLLGILVLLVICGLCLSEVRALRRELARPPAPPGFTRPLWDGRHGPG